MIAGNTIDTELWTAWQDACREIGVTVDEAQQARLATFYDHLITVNQTTNLTRLTAPEDFLYRHLLDSLTILPWIPANARVADVGSGAGFPAIPLAILRPDVTVIAIESVGKKTQFIQSCADLLALPNLQALSDRSETLGQQKAFRQSFDIVTARAVAALPVLLELCLPLLKVGGTFLAMKGLSYETELAAADKALLTLGGKLERVQSFVHPRLEGSRLLFFEKVKPTPPAYPRNPGLPGKSPL